MSGHALNEEEGYKAALKVALLIGIVCLIVIGVALAGTPRVAGIRLDVILLAVGVGTFVAYERRRRARHEGEPAHGEDSGTPEARAFMAHLGLFGGGILCLATFFLSYGLAPVIAGNGFYVFIATFCLGLAGYGLARAAGARALAHGFALGFGSAFAALALLGLAVLYVGG